MQLNQQLQDAVRCYVTISLTLKHDSDCAGRFAIRYRENLIKLFNIFATQFKPNILLKPNIVDFDKRLKWRFEFFIPKNQKNFDNYGELFSVAYKSFDGYIQRRLKCASRTNLLDIVTQETAISYIILDLDECQRPVEILQEELDGHWKKYQNTYLNDLHLKSELYIWEPAKPKYSLVEEESDKDISQPATGSTNEETPTDEAPSNSGKDNEEAQQKPTTDEPDDQKSGSDEAEKDQGESNDPTGSKDDNSSEDDEPKIPITKPPEPPKPPPRNKVKPKKKEFKPTTLSGKIILLSLSDEPHQFKMGEELLSCWLSKEDTQRLFANLQAAKEQGILLRLTEKTFHGYKAQLDIS